MTSLSAKFRTTEGKGDTSTTLRMGQVYLDVRKRQLSCLNQTARQLHNDGIPFLPGDLGRCSLFTLEGKAVTADDLPLIISWREVHPVEAHFLMPTELGPVWRVAWSTAPVRNAAQQLIGILGSVHCAHAEPDWQAMAGLAHDLRTPLNAIGLQLALLDQKAPGEGELRQILQGMRSSVERALRVGRDLLEWCRGPASKGRAVERAWFPLESFLLDLAREQSGAAEQKGLTLAVDFTAARDWEIYTDRVHLGRLLSNLLVNAVRYTPYGRVDFTAVWREEAAGRSLTVGVVDTGMGISPEEQESIFQPFERGQAGKDSDSGGSGLGLAVVDRLVEELGLDLEVYSEHGRGSAFHLVLPADMLRPCS
jgi:signal transduction histidine kinase